MGSTFGDIFVALWGVAAVIGIGSMWLKRDRRRKTDLGPVVFAADVSVRFKRNVRQRYSFVTAHFGSPRLLVHEDAIEIRCPDTRWLGFLKSFNDVYDADEVEMSVTGIPRLWGPLLGPKDDYLVLRTRDQRGWLEIAFRPKTCTIDDLGQALKQAGARPGFPKAS